MGQRWNDYDKAAEKGPLALIMKIAVGVILLGIFLSVVGYGLGWFGEAAQVAKQEFGPKAMLVKYEWFKDAASQLEKKQADIKVYEDRVKNLAESYKGVERQKWARDDREQMSVWMSEVSGVKASFNQLASEYNAQMSKINWRFANAGELPQGADKPLPREYKEYISQ